ncbi:sugar kinase [Pseudoponticoccus marisrubri]|uniref:2-dehydro-3-deoxygluconokinase n=1 Tax=Pseudoponticoccus marisrubri TaxID=1685382 RepID=A0A0W7WNK1_9RHOB|nr:2-dehydro-3-deoxygluconokinase [Pseudoponticoccus marisrubri]
MVELAPAEAGFFRRGFAGDTFNTAWYVRRLLPADWDVSYATWVGKDAISDEMLSFIAEQGIGTETIRRVPDRTVGLYMIQTRDGERSFTYWRGQSAARDLGQDADWLDSVLAGRDMVQFSGITLAILPPEARQRFCAALERARKAGAHVAFDTNLRPRLWESPAAMAEGLTLGASVSDTVMPSFDEEVLAFGDTTPEDTIARYRAGGARCVAVKNGSETCHVWSEDEGLVRHDPPAIAKVVDSTAAGDSFGAGFLAARATGALLAEATRRAAELAAEVIQRRGALAPEIFEGDDT